VSPLCEVRDTGYFESTYGSLRIGSAVVAAPNNFNLRINNFNLHMMALLGRDN
jgi:hypothetical protein